MCTVQDALRRIILLLIPVLLMACFVACGADDDDDSGIPTATPTPDTSASPTPTPSFDGETYYVAPNGDDSNNGTEDQPWRTIYKASQTLVAGDRVYIKSGTYNEHVLPARSGVSQNYILYSVYPGDEVTLDGSNLEIDEWGGLFDLSFKSYIKLSGFRIINSSGCGVFAEGADHLSIENGYTYNTVSSGIGIWTSSNITIDRNEVELACNDGEQECITVAESHNFVVSNNEVHHGGPGSIGGEGIDAKDGSYNGKIYGNYVHDLSRLGIYVDSWDKHTYDIEVYQNVVHDCEDGFDLAAEAGGLLENIQVYNNIAYHNLYVGLTVAYWGEDVEQRPMRNIFIINNTLYNNGTAGWGGGIYHENRDAENVVIRNNICSANLSFQIVLDPNVDPSTTSIDHNLIDGFRGEEEGELYGENSVTGDPRFEDASSADFHLTEELPAIDTGSSVNAPADDFEGTSRPQGSGYDIGADEFSP